MRGPLSFKRTADDQFEIDVETPAQAQTLSDHLRRMERSEDVVAGLSCVTIRFAPSRAAEIETCIREGLKAPVQVPTEWPVLEIGVRYGGQHGPDFERVCRSLALSRDEFIALHTGCVHTVEMIGFTPGFAYISGLPGDIQIPRLEDPRPRVPAGSVGISSDYTGLYALAGPGGWPLIGRTDETLFCAESDDPFRLKPGQRLRFRSV